MENKADRAVQARVLEMGPWWPGNAEVWPVAAIMGLREDQVPPRIWRACIDGLKAVKVGDSDSYLAWGEALYTLCLYNEALKKFGWKWETRD